MFIYVVDENMKKDLIKNGFKMLQEDDNGAFFVFDKKIHYDFSSVDKTKFLFTNKLTF